MGDVTQPEMTSSFDRVIDFFSNHFGENKPEFIGAQDLQEVLSGLTGQGRESLPFDVQPVLNYLEGQEPGALIMKQDLELNAGVAIEPDDYTQAAHDVFNDYKRQAETVPEQSIEAMKFDSPAVTTSTPKM